MNNVVTMPARCDVDDLEYRELLRRIITPLHIVERLAIESAMVLCYGNVALAAERLDVPVRWLRTKLEVYMGEDEG